jgi:predicted nucleotidyltransferase
MVAQIPIPQDRIAEFCRKWQVRELSLFGSILRDDFREDSDVDVLVALAPGRRVPLEQWLAMEDELRSIFRREIDLVERRLVVNPFRRHHILTHRRVLYAA